MRHDPHARIKKLLLRVIDGRITGSIDPAHLGPKDPPLRELPSLKRALELQCRNPTARIMATDTEVNLLRGEIGLLIIELFDLVVDGRHLVDLIDDTPETRDMSHVERELRAEAIRYLLWLHEFVWGTTTKSASTRVKGCLNTD